MQNTLLLFPNQLFDKHNDVDSKTHKIVLIEESLFFNDHQYHVNFHAKKLILHRASMKSYSSYLQSKGYEVSYLDWQKYQLETFFKQFTKEDKGFGLTLYDSVDFALNRRLKRLCSEYSIKPTWLQSPLFINTNSENRRYREGKKRWFMADFYQFQRRRLDVLMEEGKPIGGKWSFDEANRKKIPKKLRNDIPELEFPTESQYVIEAREYVGNVFPDAVGSNDNFEYPINHDSAQEWLSQFLRQRFEKFGTYEDALVPQQSWLYHSVLTPMLNIGLLKPQQVVDQALEFAQAHDTPINSVEGFIRQIIGWREFMRATYVDLGVTMRTTNHWEHNNKIPKSFYDGTTGIRPIDDVIKRTLNTAYCHHIERLMVIGGFMFLCEFDPKEIYKWFMTFFIDAYDWVMVPNVFAMSQNADGGLITTKPYFSGSSYLKKMGYDDIKPKHGDEEDWCAIWDGLYWRWIDNHSDELSKNPRWAMMCSMAKKMDSDKLSNHQKVANDFLSQLAQ